MAERNFAPGQSAGATTITEASRRPAWMQWTNANTMNGTAKLPSGHRHLRWMDKDNNTLGDDDYYVYPVTLPETNAEWRMAIFAPNGSYIIADGLSGIPIIGTPVVRLAENAPAKATVTLPITRGAQSMLASSFSGWSDSHHEAISRGMEVTVEYRNKSGELTLVFRGMIYQIEKGETIEITAYDRVMDLYQYSDQYQSHEGYYIEMANLAEYTAGTFRYNLSRGIGTVSQVYAMNYLRVDALSQMAARAGDHYGYLIIHDLPKSNGKAPADGSFITKVATKVHLSYVPVPGQIVPVPQSVMAYIVLYQKIGSTFVEVDRTSPKVTFAVAGSQDIIYEWDVDWMVMGDPDTYFVGAYYSAGFTNVNGYCGSDTRYTTSEYWRSDDDGATWQLCPLPDYLPEIACEFTETYNVNLSYVSSVGNTLIIAEAGIPNDSGGYQTTTQRGAYVSVSYFALASASIQGIISALIEAAGLVPNVDGSIDMGSTDFYSSSTFDYLTCIQELLAGGNIGIRMPVAEPGRIDVLPRHTVSDAVVATFTAAMIGAGERVITSHNLTSHWMAEKATVAMLAENATQSGLPIALETDDGLMDGSLVNALQSPLRGISTDGTMGTHILMAYSAGGKIRQLHTNIVEGEFTVAGYRSDVWDLGGNYAGGKTIKVTVPDAGVDNNAVPTAVEFGNGVTKITIDNIRRNERSELARSMGLTADNVSNESRQIPSTCWIFAKINNYDTQQSGITPGTVTKVECVYNPAGMAFATQTDGNYIKTLTDPAGYHHICAVFPADPQGYTSTYPIRIIRITMGGSTYYAVVDNDKYAVANQAIHVDVRFRPS